MGCTNSIPVTENIRDEIIESTRENSLGKLKKEYLLNTKNKHTVNTKENSDNKHPVTMWG
tara:strand:+ start:5200 stop:5379 length:180 start_codon:yes stop_codon:yes gene_type:complete